jgi:L,D-transpeptidase YcbB
MSTSWLQSASILAFALLLLVPGFASGLQASATGSACEDLLPVGISDAPVSAVPWTLCRLIETGRMDDLAWPNFENYREQLREFYVFNKYAPAWVSGQEPTSQARAMIGLLAKAGFDGLNADDYDGPRWQQRLDQLAAARDDLTAENTARFDLGLTVATMRYLNDLHTGRVSPVFFHFGLEAKKFDAAEFLRRRVLGAADGESAIKELEPPFPGYGRTKEALKYYLALAREGEGDSIPAPIFPLKAGSTYSGMGALAARLQRLGDLPQNATIASLPNIYGGPVVAAVADFQQRHGLKPVGELTQETYDQLTTPFARRVAQLQLTLERWRWLPARMESPLIVVNIPEFRLRAYEDHRVAVTMRAIVGEASDHQTPVFADRIEAIVFRPYWNVPESIEKMELIAEIKRHPHYLLKHQMQVVDGRGQVVTADLVTATTLRRLQAGKLMIRQQPGPANALGLVKFVFPNQYSIYMHGTPETGLFARARRDLSHGCIRLENPSVLATWVLRGDSDWTAARVKAAMEAKDSIEVKLPRSIPILILYGTALVEENGKVNFFNDIYGFDASLQTALARRHDNPH